MLTMHNVGAFVHYAGALYIVHLADETSRLYILENARTGHVSAVSFAAVAA